MLNFAWPTAGLPEPIRVYRQMPERVARYAYHIQFECKIQRNWQILKAQTTCCVDSTLLSLKRFLERNAQFRATNSWVTRTDSGLPPDARNSSEIRVSHTFEVQCTTKLAYSESTDHLLCRFDHALMKTFPRMKCKVLPDQRQGYPNRLGSPSRCPK